MQCGGFPAAIPAAKPGSFTKLFHGNHENYPYLVGYNRFQAGRKNRQIMKKDTLEHRMMQERQRLKVPDSKLLSGSTKDKYPVVLDGGRTIIFIDDKSKESETRKRYDARLGNGLMASLNKPK